MWTVGRPLWMESGRWGIGIASESGEENGDPVLVAGIDEVAAR